MFDLYVFQLDLVLGAYQAGMRSGKLDSQPAPWMLFGLQCLERGEELTVAKIAGYNRAGGTDHPDPTISF